MTDLDPIVLAIGPASDPRPGVAIRLPLDYALEVAEDLRADSILLGFPVQAALSVMELSAVMASTAGGLSAVAAVLRTFVHRHQHRSIRLTKRDGTSIELSGLPPDESAALLDRYLAEAQQAQDEVRHLYQWIQIKDKPAG